MIKRNLHSYCKVILVVLITFTCVKSGSSEEPLLNSKFINVISSYKTGKAIFSSPVSTYNNNVVVGSHDKSIYFFNSSGILINKYKTDGWVHASPSVLSDSSVAIGSYDGFIYFFDQNGKLRNKVKPGGGALFTSIIELTNRLLVFGTNKKGVIFYNREDSTI